MWGMYFLLLTAIYDTYDTKHLWENPKFKIFFANAGYIVTQDKSNGDPKDNISLTNLRV